LRICRVVIFSLSSKRTSFIEIARGEKAWFSLEFIVIAIEPLAPYPTIKLSTIFSSSIS
jgi:hypothetical protein